MFTLIFSPFGAIQRKQYFYGLLLSIMMVIICYLIAGIIMVAFVGVNASKPGNYLDKQASAQLDLDRAQAEMILASKNPSPADIAKAQAIVNKSSSQVESTPLYKLYTHGLIVIGIALGLLILWCNVCLMIKRLRDLAVTPWLAAIPFGVLLYMFLPCMQVLLLIPYCWLVIAAFYLLCLFYPSRQ